METLLPTYGYATLRFLTDANHDITVPAGVIQWNSDSDWQQMMYLQFGDEQFPLLPAKATAYLRFVKSQIEGWIQSGHLPYEPHPFKPLSREWWEHVQKLLQHSVRIDAIQILELANPE